MNPMLIEKCVAQDQETTVQLTKVKPFSYRYAYARSADTAAASDIGQDYLALRHDDRTFVFALCDGVSQSFYGNLAARLLGDALVTWLWDELPPGGDDAAIGAALNARLLALTAPATELVQQHPLPNGLALMLREVLEQKRASGSDSTFVCGRIDLPCDELPQGRLILAWMGDSRLRIWGPEGERSAELGGCFDTAQRWSSRRGPVKGRPNVYVSPLTRDGRPVILSLAAYSDGLSRLDGRQPPSNFGFQAAVDDAHDGAASDDISHLELWLGPVPAHIKAAPLPAHQDVAVTSVADGAQVNWSPVPHASSYQVQLRNGEIVTWTAASPPYRLPALPAGRCQVRVRAMQAEEPGVWSALCDLETPALPIPAPTPQVEAPPATAAAPVSALPVEPPPSAVAQPPVPARPVEAPKPASPPSGVAKLPQPAAPPVLPAAQRPVSAPGRPSAPPQRPPSRPSAAPLKPSSVFPWPVVGIGCLLVVCLLVAMLAVVSKRSPLHKLIFGPTPTFTPTATLTPTATWPPTATATPSRTPSPTPTVEPTNTPTPRPSATATPSATLTTTTTRTPTQTLTYTPSWTPSPTATSTRTATTTPTVRPTTATPSPAVSAAPPAQEVVVLGSTTQYPVQARVVKGWGYELVDASTQYDWLIQRDAFGQVAHNYWGNDGLYGRHSQGIRITLQDYRPSPACKPDGSRCPPLVPVAVSSGGEGDNQLTFDLSDGAGAQLWVGCAENTKLYDPQECFVVVQSSGAHLTDIVVTATILAQNLRLKPVESATPDFTLPVFAPLGRAYREGDQWRWADPFLVVVPAAPPGR